MATAHPAIAAHAQTVTAAIALNAWAASPLMVSLSIPKAPLSLPPRGGLPCKPLPAMSVALVDPHLSTFSASFIRDSTSLAMFLHHASISFMYA